MVMWRKKMFNLYFTALKSLAIKETNRYLRIWVQTLVPPVITTSLYFVIFGKMIEIGRASCRERV